MSSVYPERAVPISLSTNYLLTTDQRMMIITSLQIPKEFLSFSSEVGKQQSYDSYYRPDLERSRTGGRKLHGRDCSQQRPRAILRIQARRSAIRIRSFSARDSIRCEWRHAMNRVAAPAAHIHGSKFPICFWPPYVEQLTDWDAAASRCDRHVWEWRAGHADIVIQRRFRRGSALRFFLFMYNAARAGSDSKPDMATRMLILRDNQPVVTTDFKKMATEDGAVWSRSTLCRRSVSCGLAPGRYILHMDVIDRVSKRRASQQTRFEIE